MENKIHSEKGGKTNGRAWKTNGKQGKNMKENLWKMKDNLSRTKKQTNLQHSATSKSLWAEGFKVQTLQFRLKSLQVIFCT